MTDLATGAVITTPTVRRAVKRWLFWIGAATLVVLLGVLMVALNGAGRQPQLLGPSEAAPVGAQALVRVLEDNGITVSAASSLDQAESAVASAGGAGVTLLVADTLGALSGEDWQRLAGLADHLVLVEPEPTDLDALDLPLSITFPTDGVIETDASCGVRAAERAGSIEGAGLLYDVEADARCFVTEDGAALVRFSSVTTGGPDLSVFGVGEALTNETITRAGNAALALGLLGEHPDLVWYLPGPADIEGETIADLTPAWVNPVAWTLLLTGVAAALWRGRRLGPVVIEDLPVVVRTTESMEGRARLYARDGSRLRALDALRVGTLRRLSTGLALGRASGVEVIIAAVADITGRDPRELRALLLETEPGDDRDLVRLSDQLLDLERAVQSRVALGDAEE